jgi:hypothetical protein
MKFDIILPSVPAALIQHWVSWLAHLIFPITFNLSEHIYIHIHITQYL